MEAERPKRGLLHQRRGQESGNAAVVADDRKGGDGSWGVRSRPQREELALVPTVKEIRTGSL